MATTNKNFKVKNGLEVAGEIGVGSTPSYGTTGQILSSQGAGNAAAWIDNYSTSIKHEVKLGEAVTKGQAVYISSANGTNMIASKASNVSEQYSSKTMGLIETTGSTNDFVNVITEGLLSGLNTSSATAGDPVWLGTSGNLIYGLTNKPIAPAHLVFIGIVTRAHSTQGEIFVRPQNGFELNELHTVLIGTDYNSVPADNNILAYDSASSLWKNQTAEQAGVANLAGATFTGNVAGTNANLSGNVNSTTVNTTTLLVGGDANVAGKLSVTAKSGDEGGEIFLSNAATNTVITNGVTIDVYQNKLRFFEQGGDARGFFINVASGGGGASTNLVGGGSGDGNTTYNISAVTTTGGSLLRLTSVDPSGTDDVKFAGSGATTVAFTDANTITISSTDTTYTNGTGLTLTGNSFSVTSNTYQPIDADLTAIAALANSAGYLYNNGTGTFSYSTPTDTNTTYTLGAAGTTSPTITLTPSSGSANTITLATSGTGISFGQSSGTITLTSNASDANGASTIVARNATGNFTANTVIANLTGTADFANTAFSVSISNVTSMGTNVSTFLATPNSLNLLNTVTDETGSGSLVFATNPVLTTPNIGAATGTSVNVTGQLISTVVTGTSPLAVTSNTTVANLSANLLNGYTTANTSTANTVVLRDTNGSFSANIITANLTGTASNATSAAQVNTTANNSGGGVGYLTFVSSNTSSTQTVYTDTGLKWTPATNALSAGYLTASSNVTAGENVSAVNFVNNGAQLNVISTAYPMLLQAVDGITLSGPVTAANTVTISGTAQLGLSETQAVVDVNNNYTYLTNTYTVNLASGNYFSNITLTRAAPAQAWTYVGNTRTTTTAASGTFTLPSGMQNGDYVAIIIGCDSTGTYPNVTTTTYGTWTPKDSGSTTHPARLFVKRITDAANETSVAYTTTAGATAIASMAIRNIASTVTVINNTTAVSASYNPPNTTPSYANSAVFIAGFTRDIAVTAVTHANTAYNGNLAYISTSSLASGVNAAVMISFATIPTVIPEDAATFTVTGGTAGNSAAFSAAISSYVDPTITLINGPTGTYVASTYVLHINNANNLTTTWSGATFAWQGGSAPTLSSSAPNNIVILETINGTTFRGALLDSYA